MKPPIARLAFCIALALLHPSSNAFAAVCEEGAGKAIPSDATTYARRHKIMEAVDGLTLVEDTVRLWRRDAGSLCFSVDTVHTSLHFCSLSGEAKHIRPNVYWYSDGTCKVEIEVTPKKVSLRVTDSTDRKRDLCNPVEAFGCGSNTAIQSGIFARKR
jgi:hypothetical protein